MDFDPDLDLEISRHLDAPLARVWACWADPALLSEWFCPRPWRAEPQEYALRAGGAFDITLHGPAGEKFVNRGLFVEVVPMQRIVSTSLLTRGWRPAAPELPMTSIWHFSEEGAGTRYVARVLHADAASRKRHEEMGFHQGWGICADQMEELAGRQGAMTSAEAQSEPRHLR